MFQNKVDKDIIKSFHVLRVSTSHPCRFYKALLEIIVLTNGDIAVCGSIFDNKSFKKKF